MEKKITIELPIVKVNVADNWLGCDYAKEHYNKGLFIVDDGVMYHFVFYNGDIAWEIPCPLDVVETHIVEKAIRDNDEIYHKDMESIEGKLSQIARLLGETKDEVRKSENRLTDVIVEERAGRITDFNILRNGLESIEKSKNSGEGTNVLDVAKAFAVISKPELIKELNK